MRAIVLSAGQGKRLLPLTATRPKCLLDVGDDQSVLDLQLGALSRCGIEHTTVLVGFGAEHVDHDLAVASFGEMEVTTLYNPFYAITDNLATCWVARVVMTDDFILLNGDTLFEDDLLRQVLEAPEAPIAVTVDRKPEYDADDMKVTLDADRRLAAIGKQLPLHTVDGESIGMLRFQGTGVQTYTDALDLAMRRPESLSNWYLSVVNELAQKIEVQTTSIEGLWWAEIDSPEDLAAVRGHFLQPDNHPDATRSTDRPVGSRSGS
ncbi:MAG: phosphocholine cytidylyltransferase family protein [Deltaproteobacteria bacterium]|nr:phosphocholine cytidylyltransferase family protein [Deltaproteobacteria bacterium]